MPDPSEIRIGKVTHKSGYLRASRLSDPQAASLRLPSGVRWSIEQVIANSTGPNNRCRPASVTDNATQFFPTSTATTTVDDDTSAAPTDTTHLRGHTEGDPPKGTPSDDERT